ncbi:hypothetical protein Tco_0860672 [Tanacetum coccineum]|uniref:Uncharacterized protein n=1 Tax=Tanacetum coccineum TaxID=301880 RepID=A0ABQ5BFK6_9ASTR
MERININDLTIEQYLRLTQENQASSMVKKVDDMTIAEYMKYEERMKRKYKLDEEVRYTTDEESVMSEQEVIDPAHAANTQYFEEELSSKEDLDEWLKAEMENHMSNQKEKNEEDALIAIIKSIREECRVVHKNKQMSASEADKEESFEAMETQLKMTTLQVFEKSKQRMLRQWVCFRDHKRHTVKGSCIGFADFLQVCYGNQRIDDLTRELRYYEWVSQNYKFDNNRTPSTTTVSYKYLYNTNYPTPITLNEWDTSEWILDSFDVEEEYAKEIGYVLDDVWEKCEQYHRKTIDSWHDEGFEEDEL